MPRIMIKGGVWRNTEVCFLSFDVVSSPSLLAALVSVDTTDHSLISG